MSNYTIASLEIDAATGLVMIHAVGGLNKFTLVLTECTIDENTPNTARLVFEAHDWSETMQGGVYFEDINGTLEIQPHQPAPHNIFNWHTKQWEDPRTVQELKRNKWRDIKEAREAAINAVLITPYGMFDSDAKSRATITGAVLMASLYSEFSIDWTLADNTLRTLNAQEMISVGMYLSSHTSLNYQKGRRLRIELEAALTIKEVASISW